MLFDLHDDPHELRNVFGDRPDVATWLSLQLAQP
jgi:hypothetical protein